LLLNDTKDTQFDYLNHPKMEKEVLIEFIITFVNHLMDHDSKTGALKKLQGTIWRSAYQKGQIKGQLVQKCSHFRLLNNEVLFYF
jgi:methionine salvage enolase-phosphatase E1